MHSKDSVANKAVVAYVPALHAGYLSFFKKYADCDFFVLGTSLINITPRMERDIRSLTPEQACDAIRVLNIFPSVTVLEQRDVKQLRARYSQIILPDEDVSRNFAKKLLQRRKVTFETVFLRWDKIISTTEFQIPPDRTVSIKSADLKLLREASHEAVQSPDWWRQIGAVLVKGKKVQIRAYNRHFPNAGTPATMGDPRSNFDYGEQPEIYLSIHAEADVVAQAAKAGISTKNAEVYVTTFPCPNCAHLLVRAGIKRLYYAQGYSKLDAEEILKKAGVQIVLVKTK
ncbi:hypothetical protein A3G63_01015 [Candidatus Kaiserbacteria bacterium RIFCSPLOWO2_12_FULL_52_8]|nr:MAG: hypothetical protein A3G63_01015 [Candidatus Kaiserbacteria bacterium RIFCSPLOWO2_12_FULL_52_8]